jgi:hypothetical protein
MSTNQPKIPFLVLSCHEGIGVSKAKIATSFTQTLNETSAIVIFYIQV